MATKKVKQMEVVQEEVVNQEVSETTENNPVLKLKLKDAEQFLALVDVILVEDDRAKPIKTHFIELIKRNNENNQEQSGK